MCYRPGSAVLHYDFSFLPSLSATLCSCHLSRFLQFQYKTSRPLARPCFQQLELEGKLIRAGAHGIQRPQLRGYSTVPLRGLHHGIQRPQLRGYSTVPLRGLHLACVSNAEQG
jgi:hypothetical protein